VFAKLRGAWRWRVARRWFAPVPVEDFGGHAGSGTRTAPFVIELIRYTL
jgi:hypothetical protein